MGNRPSFRGTAVAVQEICHAAKDGTELFRSVDEILRDALKFDGATWFGTDPATLLSTAPLRIHGIEAGHCTTFWEREFFVEDAMLFRHLSRAAEPVASLRAITDDRPVRSPRFREFLAPQGYGDELRAVFKTGDRTWGITALYRDKGRPAFNAEERAMMADVAGSIAKALRRHVTTSTPWQHTPLAPGLLLFDGGGRLLSTNAEADTWLGELEAGNALFSPHPEGVRWVAPAESAGSGQPGFPSFVIMLVARARAIAEGHEKGPARLRVRSRSGQWLALHASCMSPGTDSTVAVVIEPASSTDIAPIIVEAYALSPRERDIVRAIARGLTSPQIGTELHLSPHTVRDYVKSVFEKVGVSSRGELIAKLFADHYYDALAAAYFKK